MSTLPPIFGRAVYAEIDEPASADPLHQAAGWLARLEPWFGPCSSVGVTQRQRDGIAATVVMAGHDGDSAIIVHLVTGRPISVPARLRVEGSQATLQKEGTILRLTKKGEVLVADGVDLPDGDPARWGALHGMLENALTSGQVETVHG
jgi:hypothetical protein